MFLGIKVANFCQHVLLSFFSALQDYGSEDPQTELLVVTEPIAHSASNLTHQETSTLGTKKPKPTAGMQTNES